MNSTTDISALRSSRPAIAYLLAVTTASLMFVLAIALQEAPSLIAGQGFASARAFGIHAKLVQLAGVTALLFVLGWIFAFFTALIPFAIGIAIARHFAITHWLYFVLGGALTAIALEALFISIPDLGINVQEPAASFGQQYLTALPNFLASGVAAGASCIAFLRSGIAHTASSKSVVVCEANHTSDST
jgi:hypothetical protein